MEASLDDGVFAGFLDGPINMQAEILAKRRENLFFLFLHSPLDVVDLDNDAVDIAKCLGRLSHFFQGEKGLLHNTR